MKRILSTIILLIFTSFFAKGQDWGIPVAIDFPRLGLLSLDNQGYIFVSDLEGNLYQYDQLGQRVNNFSPQRQGALSQLEASWTVNIFTFSQDLQEYRILDRFINPVAENRIPLQHITLAKAATLGNNNIIWVYDEADLSLKQLDYRQNRITQNQPLNLVLAQSSLDILDIREHMNMVFIHIFEEGVYILDNQANFLRQLPSEFDQKLSFWKENLVYLNSGEMILQNLRNGEKKSYEIPESIPAKAVFINNKNVIFQGANKIWIFPLSQTPLQ